LSPPVDISLRWGVNFITRAFTARAAPTCARRFHPAQGLQLGNAGAAAALA